MSGQRRGVALVQALLIVAALAALALTLVQRSDGVVARLEGRFGADQAGLYLDSGMDLVREGLPRGMVHPGQDWARPRDGIVIGEGVLAWRIDDLQGRFNLGWTAGSDRMRQAFERLARAQGLTPAEIEESLRFGPQVASFGWFPADQFVVMTRNDNPQAMVRLAALITTLPADRMANINTLRPEVLAALAPDLSEDARRTILSRVAAVPVASMDSLLAWVEDSLGDETRAILATLPLGTGSTSFAVRIEVRLDTLRLARSGVLDTGEAETGRALLRLAHPLLE